MPDITSTIEIVKADAALGLVFGFAIVCKDGGADHYDLQEHHIPEDVMLAAAANFAMCDRVAKDMHTGEKQGDVLFMFPLTTDIAKAFDITTPKTGLMMAMKPEPQLLAKFLSGEYTGFSIGGGGQLKEAA